MQGEAAVPAAAAASEAPAGRGWRFPWVALLDHVDWTTGRTEPLPMNIGLSVTAIYARLSASQASLGGTRSFGDLLLVLLLFVSGLFLIIEVVALVMGLALARSITGAVHELFEGTERVRQGDFGHRIPVLAKDQLGELAKSFNQMTGSIEDLLRQAAEKKRLEEEMRLAREIQMSLLPRGPLLVPGLSVSALCVPAREVGGDYYDVLPLPDGRVRDPHRRRVGQGHVGGALHGRAEGPDPLAEPDPPVAARAAHEREPPDLDAPRQPQLHHDDLRRDRPGGRHDDVRARRAHAAAVPAGRAARAVAAQILAPDGLVLGLRIDDGERFASLLAGGDAAASSPGDLLVFFTDGISEAMNERVGLLRRVALARTDRGARRTCPSTSCASASCARSTPSSAARRSTTT